MNNYVRFNYIMPGRQQIPSFQIASGTSAERDSSYNIPTGSIFFNTDTSNIELSGNVVVAADISGVDKITFADGTEHTSAGCVGFMCDMTAGRTYSSGAALYYDDTLFDTDSGVTQTRTGTVSTKYTIPKAGYWWFGISASGYNSNIGLAVYRNSDKVFDAGHSMPSFYDIVTFGIVECAVDDIITPTSLRSTTFREDFGQAYFQGYYIGSA